MLDWSPEALAARRAERARQRRRYRLQQTAGALASALVIAGLAWLIYRYALTGQWPWTRVQTTTAPVLRVLVLGSDGSGGQAGRADTMLLFTFDEAHGQVGVLSIPRDTRLTVPGLGETKVNAAYTYKGAAFATEVVSRFLGVPIDHYVAVDFAGFTRIVDALGGVDVQVDEPMDYDDTAQNLHIHFQPGLHHLDGRSALEYIRYRGAMGDVTLLDPQHHRYAGRIERELNFVRALAAQALRPQALMHLPTLVSGLHSAVTTDLSTLALVRLGLRLQHLQTLDWEMGVVPGRGAMVGGVSYWLVDQPGLARAVDRYARLAVPQQDR